MLKISIIKLLVKIKEITPDVKSFLMTAFELDPIESEISKNTLEISEIIQKPITIKETYYHHKKHIKINDIK